MNVERRLHHAARELREVTIEAPPLGDLSGTSVSTPPSRPTRARPRLAALAAPVLFVAGGMLAVGVMQQPDQAPVHSDIGTVRPSGDDAEDADGSRHRADVPSLSDELRLIRGIVESAPDQRGDAITPDESAASAPGPS